jgi:hypothetical protein
MQRLLGYPPVEIDRFFTTLFLLRDPDFTFNSIFFSGKEFDLLLSGTFNLLLLQKLSFINFLIIF